jgi:alpha-ketoglutaric semialdehyde dehydrogenase
MAREIGPIIGGRSLLDGPGGRFTSVNPADTADEVAEVALGDAGTFVEACRAAREAQREWAAVPAPVRGRAIQQIGRLIEANKEALSRILTRDVGKPIVESRGEVQEAIDTCDFFLGEGRRLYGQTVPSEMPDKQLFTFREPVGVVSVITAGNFPVAVPAWYMIPALLTGNAVVWKPAEYAPAVSVALAEILNRGGIPEGVVNLALIDGPTTSDGLDQALQAGVVDKVGFTGSSEVGRHIGELTGRHLQSPCLELGGNNPLVVMPDAELDLAVEGALFSGFGTAGQRCTSLGTAIVHASVHDEFLGRLTAAVEDAAIGDPMDESVLYGPMISERFTERFLGWLDMIEGHHTIHGSGGRTGRITPDNPREGFVGDPTTGFFCHPTIVDGVTLKDELYLQETFGPIIGVATFSDLDEALELANAHGYGLSSSIYTTDPRSAFRFREGVTAGMVSVNNSTSGAEAHLPFGGNGRSGNGSRLSGMWVLEEMTRWQAMNWDYSGRLQKAQMDVADVDADLDFRLDT